MTGATATEPVPIQPADVLARADLVSPDEIWGRTSPGRLIRDSGVTIGRPLLYQVAEEDLPERIRKRSRTGEHRYVGMLIAFDLERLQADHAYADVKFTAELAGDRVIAVELEDDAAPPAGKLELVAPSRVSWLLRLADRTACVTMSGRHSPRFAWTYEAPRGGVLTRYNYAMNAVLEAPPETAEVAGVLSVRAEIMRTFLGYSHRHVANLRDAEPFAVPLFPNCPSQSTATRLCFAVDVERYTRHNNETAKRTQHRLVRVVERTLDHAQVDRTQTEVQEQGDGRLVILPTIDEPRVIPALADGLRRALREVNTDLGQGARVRLRAALDRGLVERAENGYVGNAVIYVHRVIEAKPTKDALAANPRSDFVLAVSDYLYQDVVSNGYHDLDPEMFWKVIAELPGKNFSQPAWLYVPSDKS